VRRVFAAATVLALSATVAAADSNSRTVEIRFAPSASDLQIAVWIERADGTFVDTAYVTRLTGEFGLGNRPGAALLKTDFRWPFGRREMVLPVWAHRRNHHYPKILMGGICGDSPDSHCPDGSLCGGDCVDSTIAYHPRVSSYEPFYCSPSGATKVDAMSCASKGTFSKGAYAPVDSYSLYPPRADLTSFSPTDSPDARDYASKNDLVAISRATPMGGALVDPPVIWLANGIPDGDYLAWIELSRESDFNAFHNHPNQDDSIAEWNFEGHPFLGQPSIVYRVPFHLGASAVAAITSTYAGYGDWDGASGALHPPDATISDAPGTGAGRLLDTSDGTDRFRVKIVVGAGCGGSDGGAPAAPDPVTHLALTPSATSLAIAFDSPAGGVRPNRFIVRYREGATPITDGEFDAALDAGDQPMPSSPGAEVTTVLHGLFPSTTYAVAVRAVSPCGGESSVESAITTTPAQVYATLSGCFVATAAFGTPGDRSVAVLRAYRDRTLLGNALGRLLVSTYYGLSPSLARAIAGDERLRAAARRLLAPLVERLN
jgi:hypothetical protein